MEADEAEEPSYVPLRPKASVTDEACGRKKISHIQFGTFGPDEIGRLSEFEAVNRNAYEQATRTPEVGGVLDCRLARRVGQELHVPHVRSAHAGLPRPLRAH